MLDDARQVPNGSTVSADVVVIGGGAAGITLAMALQDGRRSVVVLEGGLAEFDDRHQSLYDGVAVGQDYDLRFSRLRQLGGSTNHWTGYCRPLDPLDFVERRWVPDSQAWPVSRQELAPWYRDAALICELEGPVPDLADDWRSVVEGGDDPFLFEDSEIVTSSAHQLSQPTRFGERYRDDLVTPPAELLRVLTGANVTALRCSDASAAGASTVDRVEVTTFDGNSFNVSAPVVVLATGGIEIPRLLLSSAEQSDDPLPLPNDLVGRYFSDHLEGVVGDLVTVEPLSVLYTAVLLTRLQAVLRPADSVSRDEELLATAFALRMVDPDQNDTSLATGDLAVLLGSASGSMSPATLAAPAAEGPFLAEVHFSIETEPDRDSRVTLGDEVDELGMRRSQLDWRVPEGTFDSLDRAFEIVADDLAARQIGRLRRRAYRDEGIRVGWHHMGTTRMHPDPNLGVVDENAKVHGIDNLWIASSSVFASAGSANPTLTIVALALRLADHLDRRGAA